MGWFQRKKLTELQKLRIKLKGYEAEYKEFTAIYQGATEISIYHIDKIGDLARIIGELQEEIRLLEESEERQMFHKMYEI